MSGLNKKVTSNLLWRFLERFGAQGVTLIVSIILARILNPDIYGTIALVTIITTILQVFIDSGLGTALIQKKDSDDIDFSSVFYFNLIVCIILYALLFFSAPLIADFYLKPELTSIIRALGFILIISGFKNIQTAYVSKHLLFKKYFFATLGGTVAAAFIGIWMAYEGFGVWSLVAQNLINQTVDTIILWATVKWKPRLCFSWTRLKKLISYGWKLLVSSLIDTVWVELRQIIIGKKFSSEDLAFYNKGEEYPKYATTALNSSIDSVLLPTMSIVQDNQKRLRDITRRSIRISSYCIWPMMIGLAVCAQPLVSFFLTDKWLNCVLFLQIFCITYAFRPIHTSNLNAIKAMGRSDIFLILELIKKTIGLLLILITMWYGPIWLALSALIGNIFYQIINSWPNRSLLHYSYGEQLLDIMPSVGLSIIMGFFVYLIIFIPIPSWSQLLIQIPLGIILYIGLSKVFNLESLQYIINTGKGFLLDKKKRA